MSDKTSVAEREPETKENDLVWGARDRPRIDRTPAQIYHLLSTGALDSAVSKLGHKTIVGSRTKLRNLPFKKSK
jgi:hypothetical protein